MSRRDDIIDAAGQLLERDGTEGLTMRAVAGELGIRAPSLYKHIADKRELEIAVVAAALEQQAEAFERVTANSGDSVPAIAAAYRSWALEHPHLYALMNDQPLPATNSRRASRNEPCFRSSTRSGVTWIEPVPHGHLRMEW